MRRKRRMPTPQIYHIKGRRIHRLQSKPRDAITILVSRTKTSKSKIHRNEFKCAQTWETQLQNCLTSHPRSLSAARRKHQSREEKSPKPNQASKIHQVIGMTVLTPMRRRWKPIEKIEGEKSRPKAEQPEHRHSRRISRRCRAPWNPRLRRTRCGPRRSVADRWRKSKRRRNRVVIGTRAPAMSGCEEVKREYEMIKYI